MTETVRLTLLFCSLLGGAIAVVFLGMTSGSWTSLARILPAFCRLDAGTCQHVLQHPDARLFGVPNAIPGLLFFCTVFCVVLLGPDGPLIPVVRILSWCAAAVSVELLYSLFVRVRARCVLCMISHALTFLVGALLTFAV